MRFLVYARRDWSFMNIEPVLDEFEYDRWCFEMGKMPDLSQYDAIITCEPHIEGWIKTYPQVKGKLPIIALQQTLFWTDVVRPNSSWLFDHYFVWGKQMYEMAIKHDCSKNKIIVTGNPRFDKFYEMQTEDRGFILILGGGGGDTFESYPKVKGPFMHIPHPIFDNGRMYQYSEEMMRIAGGVMFQTTGGGIIPMIMQKPVMIKALTKVNDRARMNGYTRFMKSKLYGAKSFGTDPTFVQWTTTGESGSCERVAIALRSIL